MMRTDDVLLRVKRIDLVSKRMRALVHAQPLSILRTVAALSQTGECVRRREQRDRADREPTRPEQIVFDA